MNARQTISGAITLGVIVSCTNLVGIGDAPPTKLTCGELLHGDCETCGVASCCQELEACAASPSCGPLERCLDACTNDPSCRSQCTIDHATNDSTYPTLASCLASSCDVECGPACGWTADIAPPAVAAACRSCIVANACGLVSTCLANPGCYSTALCVNSAPVPDVTEECATQDPYGATLFKGTVSQIAGKCASDCALGEYWTCVGHVSWPRSSGASTSLVVRAFDIVQQTPIPYVTMRLCAETTPDCAIPLETEQGDSLGFATFTPKIFGGAGNTGPTGFLDIQADCVLYPELFYWSFPLTQDKFQTYASGASPDEITELANSSKVTLNLSEGHVLVQTFDCRNSYASNVTITVSDLAADSKVIYFSQGQPDLTRSVSDSTGSAGVFNVPVGSHTLTVAYNGVNEIEHVTFYVRAGTLTYVLASPTPPQ